jgi:hypothetical protein
VTCSIYSEFVAQQALRSMGPSCEVPKLHDGQECPSYLDAYDQVVNGKPAIEWVMERQAVTTDKASSIVNDANRWATETVGRGWRLGCAWFSVAGFARIQTSARLKAIRLNSCEFSYIVESSS